MEINFQGSFYVPDNSQLKAVARTFSLKDGPGAFTP